MLSCVCMSFNREQFLKLIHFLFSGSAIINSIHRKNDLSNDGDWTYSPLDMLQFWFSTSPSYFTTDYDSTEQTTESSATSSPENTQSTQDKNPPAPEQNDKPETVGFTRRSTPQKHIAFIKSHKCASSTIQNMLMRYGFYNKLTFILPKGGGNHIGWPSPYNPNSHSRKMAKTPDIFCYHSVYSPKLTEVMPADTFYLSAVRDPFTQSRSQYVYYNVYGCSKHKTLSQVVNSNQGKFMCGVPFWSAVSYDLGLPLKSASNPSEIDRFIDMVDRQFHLIMVVEYFDESLIILRDMLGWSDNDILSFAVNFRQQKTTEISGAAKAGVDLEDTPENRANLYNKFPADTKLYLHFKKKLFNIIEANKDYINKEVEKLHSLRNTWMNFCISKSVPTGQISDKRFRTWGNAAYGYVLTEQGLQNQTCIDLAMAELPWVGRLNKYQPPAP